MRQEIAVGIIKRNGLILLCQRPANKVMAGYWEFPGGKREKNESSLSALEREINEELGIKIIRAHFLLHYYCEYSHGSMCLAVWHITVYNGKIRGNERQNFVWCPQKKVLDMNLLPLNRELVRFINHYALEHSSKQETT